MQSFLKFRIRWDHGPSLRDVDTFLTIICPSAELTWVPTRGWLSTFSYISFSLSITVLTYWESTFFPKFTDPGWRLFKYLFQIVRLVSLILSICVCFPSISSSHKFTKQFPESVKLHTTLDFDLFNLQNDGRWY